MEGKQIRRSSFWKKAMFPREGARREGGWKTQARGLHRSRGQGPGREPCPRGLCHGDSCAAGSWGGGPLELGPEPPGDGAPGSLTRSLMPEAFAGPREQGPGRLGMKRLRSPGPRGRREEAMSRSCRLITLPASCGRPAARPTDRLSETFQRSTEQRGC